MSNAPSEDLAAIRSTKWLEEPLFGGSLGYSGSASETFRTVSEEFFSETRRALRMEISTKGELVTPRLMHKRYITLKSIGSCGGGGTQVLKQIIQSVLREDTTEQLDSAFEGITRAISLRFAQGLWVRTRA